MLAEHRVDAEVHREDGHVAQFALHPIAVEAHRISDQRGRFAHPEGPCNDGRGQFGAEHFG